ncbi:MAG: tetratricopeptide repeat protein [Treponema sp.]|nr:tetratricopeptide repeat protein [Treponema sp.]
MGEIIKKDFDGEDLNKMIQDNPDNADHYTSFMKDINYSDLKLDGLSPDEMFRIGKDHYDGENNREWDYDIAKKYYQAAAEHGCMKAMIELAFQYKRAVFPFYTKALHWFIKASEKGSAKAKYNIGEMYEEGEGVKQDYKQAVSWYEEAGKSKAINSAETDEDRKINWINRGLSCAGIIYYSGEEGLPQNREKAIECFKKAVENNGEDGVSNYYLGLEYLKGGILEKNYDKARLCLEIAVKQGYYAALDCLDYMYETGKIQYCGFKSASQWYIDTQIYGRVADQLGYILVHSEDFISETNKHSKRTIAALPDDCWLYRVINNNEDGYDKGILWLECAAETLHNISFHQLVMLYNYNKEYGKDRPPDTDKIAYFANNFYPLDDHSKGITFCNEDCNALINRFLALSEQALKKTLSFSDLAEAEQNFFLKTGFSLAADGTDVDIIKVIIENLLETYKKEGADHTARKIITQGIVSIQQNYGPDVVRMQLLDICGEDINSLEKEWKQRNKKHENAENYFQRGRIYYNRGSLDAAITDFQTALELTEDANEHEKFRSWMIKVCSEKHSAQTLDERLAPYAQMIDKLKNGASKPIGDFLNFKTTGDYVDFAAALSFFEEYELLKRLLDEAADSSFHQTFGLVPDFSLLNTPVSPKFVSWGPAPLYFITTRKPWKKMKDPRKMLKFLVDNGADVNALAADNSTALINQTCNDCESAEILQLLLEYGANPDKTAVFSDIEWTPLVHCLAPEYKEERNTEEIFQPFNELAIKQAKLLLEHGADPNLTSSVLQDLPPLVMAVRNGFKTAGGPTIGESAPCIIEFLELLIKKGANVNFTDSKKNTPLSIAMDNNLSDAEELLLKYGACAY